MTSLFPQDSPYVVRCRTSVDCLRIEALRDLLKTEGKCLSNLASNSLMTVGLPDCECGHAATVDGLQRWTSFTSRAVFTSILDHGDRGRRAQCSASRGEDRACRRERPVATVTDA